jgi:hypothetical protein
MKIREARAFNFTYRYIDDVLSINNYRFAEFLPLIYPPELEAKETTDTPSSASFLQNYRTPNNLTKGKSKLIRIQTDKVSQQPENCENRNDPDKEMVG